MPCDAFRLSESLQKLSEVVISTAAVRFHPTAEWRDPHISLLSLPVLDESESCIQFLDRFSDGRTGNANSKFHGKAAVFRTVSVFTLALVMAGSLYAQDKTGSEPLQPMAADAVPKFEVVTVKPSAPDRPQGKVLTTSGRHALAQNLTLIDLITFSYGVHPKQIVGAPEWFNTDKYDIDGVPDVDGEPNSKQFKMLFQSVLVERFGLAFHHDQKELSVYVLSVAKNGPKLKETIHRPDDPVKWGMRKPGALTMTNAAMRDFCDDMQALVMDKPVVDRTGLTGRYDFSLNWTPDESQFGGRIPTPTDDANAPPSLYAALQEQLGLKFEATRAKADAFVIDRAEKPSAN
jgi:uncharacterized protein (TIGR03435 family)